MAGILFTSRDWGNLGLKLGENEDDVLQRRTYVQQVISTSSLIFMEQTHSNVATLVSGGESNVKADAIVTQEKGVALAVLTGDCVPVLIRSNVAVAAVHVGRIGMLNNIIDSTMTLMNSLGASKYEAIFGPSICSDCYEVSPLMYNEITSIYPEAATSEEAHCLDLQSSIANQLLSHGVEVTNLGICTLENHEFFSHRRSIAQNEKEGRQAGVIFL